MKPEEVLRRVELLERNIIKQRHTDIKTKYQTLTMFKNIKKYVSYQIIKPPINVSEDGHKFECPTCHTKFDSENIADEFYLCYICGQRFKEEEVSLDEEDEEQE